MGQPGIWLVSTVVCLFVLKKVFKRITIFQEHYFKSYLCPYQTRLNGACRSTKKCDHNEGIITVNITWYNRLHDLFSS